LDPQDSTCKHHADFHPRLAWLFSVRLGTNAFKESVDRLMFAL
jgi:hypothetical protein